MCKDTLSDEPRRRDGDIPHALLDDAALTVVRRLQQNGHEAYLVGGCVRDLLAGLEPKDFDVATDARPNRIKRLFRNARIIGRRFRLAHILFGPRHVIETSTFRGPPERMTVPDEPEADVPRGRRHAFSPENVFGSASEDARRRDFTINALFYDPVEEQILDYVGGLEDMEAQIVRSIGEPRARLVEDPVRMIRAAHFAERLGFKLEEQLDEAIRHCASSLEDASHARLYIELVKVLGRGAAYPTLRRLHDLGVLETWTPEINAFLEAPVSWPELHAGTRAELEQPPESEELPGSHATWALLGAADRWGPIAHDAEDALILAPLLGPWLVSAWHGTPGRGFPGWSDTFDEQIRPMALRMSIPRRTQAQLKELLWLWMQMRQKPDGRPATRIVHRVAYPLALAFLRLDLMARDQSMDLHRAWEAFGEQHDPRMRRSDARPQQGREKGGRRERGGGRRGHRGGKGGRRGGRDRQARRPTSTTEEAAAWTPAPPPPTD